MSHLTLYYSFHIWINYDRMIQPVGFTFSQLLTEAYINYVFVEFFKHTILQEIQYFTLKLSPSGTRRGLGWPSEEHGEKSQSHIRVTLRSTSWTETALTPQEKEKSPQPELTEGGWLQLLGEKRAGTVPGTRLQGRCRWRCIPDGLSCFQQFPVRSRTYRPQLLQLSTSCLMLQSSGAARPLLWRLSVESAAELQSEARLHDTASWPHFRLDLKVTFAH